MRINKTSETFYQNMPKSHQEQAEWLPERLISWAQKPGEHTGKVVEHMKSVGMWDIGVHESKFFL